jgi:hypothetical protein
MNWLKGYGGTTRQRGITDFVARVPMPPVKPTAPAPSPEAQPGAAPTWKRGDTRVLTPTPCCPNCGDTAVKIRTSRGKDLVERVCLVCLAYWKDTR